MIRRLFIFALIISLLIISQAIFARAQDIKEGLWEISIKMEIAEEDMPMQTLTHKIRQCIKKEEPIPELETEDSAEDCRVTSKKITGNTVSWKAECKDEDGATTVTGKITYKGNSLEGLQEVRENGELIMKARLSGRWLGKCK